MIVLFDLNFLKNFEVDLISSFLKSINLFSVNFTRVSMELSLFIIINIIVIINLVNILNLLNLNISFDAILDIYINITIIPPISVINKIYPNHDVFITIDVFMHIIIVWIISNIPIDKGCFIMGVIIEFLIIIIILNLIQ